MMTGISTECSTMETLWRFSGLRIRRMGMVSALFSKKFLSESFALITDRKTGYSWPVFFKDGSSFVVHFNGDFTPLKQLGSGFIRRAVSIRKLVRGSGLTNEQLITVYKNHQKMHHFENVRRLHCSGPGQPQARREGVIKNDYSSDKFERETADKQKDANSKSEHWPASRSSVKFLTLAENQRGSNTREERNASGSPKSPIMILSPRSLKRLNFG